MKTSWLLWLDTAHSPWLNMAIDEELLLNSKQLAGRPLLRIYDWNCPAVSIGYVQDYPDEHSSEVKIVRRMTGGGIVEHSNDLTYTAVIPPEHPICDLNRMESYHIIHQAVKYALEQFNISVSLASNDAPPVDRATMQCFITPTRYDVIGDGKKYAGSAQRRTKNGILHQGSIALTAAKGHADRLRRELINGFEETLAEQFQPFQLEADLLQKAEALAKSKYATDAWNREKRC